MGAEHCPTCGAEDFESIEIVSRGDCEGPHLCRLEPCGHTVIAMFRIGQPIELRSAS